MKHIDITNVPQLERLADEVRRTQEPQMLRRGSQDLAVIFPVAAFHASHQDIWAGYDAEKMRAALAATRGALRDVDTEKLIEDIYRAREVGSRPAERP